MGGDLSFNLLFEMANDALFVVDKNEGIVLQANRLAAEWTGRSAETLTGLRFAELLAASDRSRIESLLSENPKEEPCVPLTVSLAQPGEAGLFLPCELTARSAMRDGDPVQVILLRDISRQVKVREELNLRDEAIASVGSGVTIADARLPGLPLIYVNRGFERITGYSAEEAVGRSCRFLQANDRDQKQLDVLRNALRTGQPCNVRLRNYRKDGALFWNELHISPVRTAAGELTHFVGIQLDVTDRVLDRARLEDSEKRVRLALEKEKQLNEIKTRFIRMVSHEFRTPMTGIGASAGFLRDHGDSVTREKRQRHFANIENALQRMNGMLDDVLFVSRTEADKVPFHPKPLRIGAYCENVFEELSAIHGDRRIKFAATLPPAATYLLDEALLNQILYNLLSNAIKYSPPDEPVWLSVSAEGEHLMLTVEDHGIGIPEADRKSLFEPFHRAANVGTIQGTGLGLHIARRSAELHSGSIRLCPEVDKGSRFEVILPAIPVNPVEAAQA